MALARMLAVYFIGSAATLLQRWKLLVRESTRTRQKSFGWFGITLYFLIV